MSEFLEKTSRRSFVKGTLGLAGLASLSGCGSSSDEVYMSSDVSTEPDTTPPPIFEEVFYGGNPHNCGGNCLLKVYAKNGVIRRIVTDENPEYTYLDSIQRDNLQERACTRCRAQKSWLYSSNRILYPLIQTGERGDLSTFKRVSWDEAAAYFKAKVEKIRNTWGPVATFMPKSSGMGGALSPIRWADYVGTARVKDRSNYSFPQWITVNTHVHDAEGTITASTMQDVFNSDELVLWGHNLGETIWSPEQIYYCKQAQEKGIRVTIIDHRFSQTAVGICDNFLAPVAATDPALIMAMFHLILTDYRDDFYRLYGISPSDSDKDAKLRRAVGKYTFGFFDTNPADDSEGTNSSINHSVSDPSVRDAAFSTYGRTAAGASLSAYVLGGAKQDPCNLGKSIYPDEIGFCARDYNIPGEAADIHFGKKNKCYGQVEKTPAWAAAITGVSEDKIRDLTKAFLTKNVTCWAGGGFQRNSEGEQACWSWAILMYVTKCFGSMGRAHGQPGEKATLASLGLGYSATFNPKAVAAEINALVPDKFKYDAAQTYSAGSTIGYLDPSDKSKVSNAFLEDRMVDYSLASYKGRSQVYGKGTFPVFSCMDMAEASNKEPVQITRKTWNGTQLVNKTEWVQPSLWNSGQIMRFPGPMKYFYNCGGNAMINQHADTKRNVKVLTDKKPALVDASAVAGVNNLQMNPKGYTLEFAVGIDHVMTPTQQYCDLVLPGSMGFERYMISGGWGGTNRLIFSPKISTPPGDAKAEIEIDAIIAKAFGISNYYNGLDPVNNLSYEENYWKKNMDAYTTKINGVLGGADKTGYSDFNDWKQKGFFKPYTDLRLYNDQIAYKNFYDNPGYSGVTFTKGVNAYYLDTYSGRVEAYCISLVENYEVRLQNNIDESVTLPNSGTIKTILATGRETKGRYVYPIPMYIPAPEGRHADGSHPDPLGMSAMGYNLCLNSWHMMYRSHSTFNSNPLLNELKYYKRNRAGEAAFLKPTYDAGVPQVWADDVLETVWMSAKTAADNNVKEGEAIIVESYYGKILVSAHISNRVADGVVAVGQGSWFNLKTIKVNGVDELVDVGGCCNTVMSAYPSRVGQGMTSANDTRIKIRKLS